MKKIDFVALGLTAVAVIAGNAAWEIVVKPMVSKKKSIAPVSVDEA
jgi:hypothetical protein